VPASRRLFPWRPLTSAVVACLVAAGALSAPAGAARSHRSARSAAPRVASADAIGTAEAVAAAYWGTAACSGDVQIAWKVRPQRVNAVASWANRHSSYGDPEGNYGCRVEFNPRATWSWAKFCTVLVHEFGHLTGHHHSPDPRDIMAPLFGAPLPGCVAAQPGALA
jgi:matrixin